MTTLRCPTCGKKFESDKSSAVPFCSERCQLIDLGRWLGEEHSVPVEGEIEEEDLDY